MDKELTPKQQTSEALRQAETILIMTAQHPSVDQVAATAAMAALLRKFGKKVTAIISDDMPAGARLLPTELLERKMGGLRDFIMQLDLSRTEVDKLKYTIENGKLNIHITPFSGGFQPRDVAFSYGEYQFDLVVILGVASYARIDKIYAQNHDMLRSIPLVNIDNHRGNENFGAINLIEPAAASLAEVLIALSESLQGGLIDEAIATTMLTGLYAATDRFTAAHTTAKTMTVAAQMVAMGADQQKVVRSLYRTEKKAQPQAGQSGQSGQSGGGQSSSGQRRERSSDNQFQAIQPQSAQPQPPQPQPPQPLQSPATPIAPRQEHSDTPAPQPSISLPEPLPSAQQAALAAPTVANVEAPGPITLVQQAPVAAPVATVQPPPAPEPTAMPAAEQPKVTLPPQVPQPPAVIAQPESAPTSVQAPEQSLPPEPPEPSGPTAPAEVDSSFDELLPPQQGDSAAGEPEPLINDPLDSPLTSARTAHRVTKPSNPTNNPIFAQRLDEFEY